MKTLTCIFANRRILIIFQKASRNAVDHWKGDIHLLVDHVDCGVNHEDIEKIDNIIVMNSAIIVGIKMDGGLCFLITTKEQFLELSLTITARSP